MSVENVKLFLEKAQTSEEISKAYKKESAYIEKALKEGDIKALEKIVDLAKSFGYDMTVDEFIKEVAKQNSIALDDLDSVSGGAGAADIAGTIAQTIAAVAPSIFNLIGGMMNNIKY